MDEPNQSSVPSGEEAGFRLLLALIAGMVMGHMFQDSALTLAVTESVWRLVGSAPTS